MRLIITGFNPDKKIQAIKGIRSATGLGLKDAKDVADAVGEPNSVERTVEVYAEGYRDLYAAGVAYRAADLSLGEFITALSQYPAAMRVGDLVRVLSVVEANR